MLERSNSEASLVAAAMAAIVRRERVDGDPRETKRIELDRNKVRKVLCGVHRAMLVALLRWREAQQA